MTVALYLQQQPCFGEANWLLFPRNKKNHVMHTNHINSFSIRKELATFSILKRSPRGARPSRIVRTKYSFDRACLKKGCFRSFSEVGRFFGSFTKQVATKSLKDYTEKAISFYKHHHNSSILLDKFERRDVNL